MQAMSASVIRTTVKKDGFVRLRVSSAQEAGKLAEQLGPILDVTEVRISARRTYLAGAEAIPPHTDHPSAAMILWYCNSHDMGDAGASLLIDTRSVMEALPKEVVRQYETVQMRCPGPKDISPTGTHPFYNVDARQVFYAPWLCKEEFSNLLLHFQRELHKPEHRKRIALKSGDVLVVDNRRMLHFREAIPAQSPRWLTRYWIG